MNKEEKIILNVFVTSLVPRFVLLELLPRHIVDDVLIKRPITTHYPRIRKSKTCLRVKAIIFLGGKEGYCFMREAPRVRRHNF